MARAKVKAKRKTATNGKSKTVKPKLLTDSKDYRYAGYPAAIIYDKAGNGAKARRQLLWGDWMAVTGPEKDGWLPVVARGCKGFVDTKMAVAQRVLEIIFVDIGQGDGSLVVTPDDQHIVIDAGAGDNMHRFLRWRYGGFKKEFTFEAAVISHSDLDHYGGFAELFSEEKLHFRNVYTNGLMERKGKKVDVLGPRVPKGKQLYIDDLVPTKEALEKFAKERNIAGKKYPEMLEAARSGEKIENFRMLSVEDGHVPGFGADSKISIEILGPVIEQVGGKPALRWFGDVGKTKNGHSIVLKLTYGKVKVLLGGDLNIPSEMLLLEHHSGSKLPASEDDRIALAMTKAVRDVFQVDFAKACHHGSQDFSRAFLAALNPVATIISSGDDEPHSHPRADTLGSIGKYSRGIRPLIFSTELARSAPERVKHPIELHKVVEELMKASEAAKTAAAKEKLKKRADKFKAQLTRSVATYGAINLRTDGTRVVVAQKIERQTHKDKEWDAYAFVWDEGAGDWRYESKFEADTGASKKAKLAAGSSSP